MKILLDNIFIRLFLTFLFMSPFACTLKKSPEQLMYSHLSSIYYALGDNAFENEITQREKLLSKPDKTFSDRNHKKVLLQLAMLYSHKSNPNPDFSMALQYLNQYALLDDQVSVEYSKALLRYMVENNLKYNKLIKEKEELAVKCSKLARKIDLKNKSLQKQKRILEKNAEDIKNKNEIIEKLKKLDIQLENRRADTE